MSEDLRIITLEEVAKNNNENEPKSCWIVMNGKVYDVTEFIAEHPGGEDVIIEYAGKDATEAFDDADHSKDAIEMTEQYLIGRLDEHEVKHKEPIVAPTPALPNKSGKCSEYLKCDGLLINFVGPIVIGISGYLIYKYIQKRNC